MRAANGAPQERRPGVGRGALWTAMPLAALLIASCARSTHVASSPAGPSLPGGTVAVVAQSTLRPSFQQIGRAFEALHPGTTLRFVFSADPDVGERPVVDRAGVFAASGTTVLSLPPHEGRVAYQHPFAQDQLVLITAPDRGARVAGLGSLAADDLRVAVATPERPEGADARRALQLAGVWHRVAPRVDRLASDAAVVAAVARGDADAGIVYRSEVPAAGSGTVLRTTPIPGFDNVVQTYVVIAFEGPGAASSTAFARYLAGAESQAILIDHGFMASPCDCHG